MAGDVLHLIGTALFGLLIVFTILFGFAYATRKTYMPHHAEAAGKRWEELDARMQWLARTYVNALGGGCVAVGALCVGLLAIHVQQPQQLAVISLAIGLALHWGYIGFMAWRLQRATGANTRWRVSIMVLALTLIATALSW